MHVTMVFGMDNRLRIFMTDFEKMFLVTALQPTGGGSGNSIQDNIVAMMFSQVLKGALRAGATSGRHVKSRLTKAGKG